ncbi:hypothetical protein ACU1JV_26125 [Paenibacillus sp. T2-29]|uniref:hypothetical protein n=1 Tax=Paenibacillus TaxID=44249 RepID=UPI0039BD1F63
MLEILKNLTKEIRDNYNTLGIVNVGSSSRFYKDILSDYDLEVVVKNEFYIDLPSNQRLLRKKIENDSIEVELLMIPESDFDKKVYSPLDIDHWPYETCKILYDPFDYLKNKIVQITTMDILKRDERLKLHYFEFIFSANKAKKAIQRCNLLNAHVSISQMILSLIKILFLINYHWPPAVHWLSQNFRILTDLPPTIKIAVLLVMEKLTFDHIEILINEVDKYLIKKNIDFIFDKEHLVSEVGSPLFRCVRAEYSIM